MIVPFTRTRPLFAVLKDHFKIAVHVNIPRSSEAIEFCKQRFGKGAIYYELEYVDTEKDWAVDVTDPSSTENVAFYFHQDDPTTVEFKLRFG